MDKTVSIIFHNTFIILFIVHNFRNESWESHDLYLEGSYKRIINVELIPSQSGPHIFAVPFNNSNKY